MSENAEPESTVEQGEHEEQEVEVRPPEEVENVPEDPNSPDYEIIDQAPTPDLNLEEGDDEPETPPEEGDR